MIDLSLHEKVLIHCLSFLLLDLILEHAKDKDVAFLVVGDPFG